MLRGVLISLALLIAGCSDTKQINSDEVKYDSQPSAPLNRGSDGYFFEKSQFNADSAKIKIVRYSSYKELNDAWVRTYGPKTNINSFILGYASYKYNILNDTSTCTIHIVHPHVVYRPDVYGHELMHCLHGAFHPSVGRP